VAEFVVYSRQGCHLCELLIEELLPLIDGHGELVVRDIDTRDDWREAYDRRVPVLEMDGVELCQYSLDRDSVNAALSGLAEQA